MVECMVFDSICHIDKSSKETIIKLVCITRQLHNPGILPRTVSLNVPVRPYFFARRLGSQRSNKDVIESDSAKELSEQDSTNDIEVVLSQFLLSKNKLDSQNSLFEISQVSGRSLLGFEAEMSTFFRVSLSHKLADTVNALVKHLQDSGFETFESHIDSELRFFTDLNISGGTWLSIPEEMFSKITGGNEINFTLEEFKEISKETEDFSLPTFKIASFCLFCDDSKNVFAASIACFEDKEEIFSLNEVVVLIDDRYLPNRFQASRNVFLYQDEVSLLKSLLDRLLYSDFDILFGYDFGFKEFEILTKKHKSLKLGPSFLCFGRYSDKNAFVKHYQTYSATWVRARKRMSTNSNQQASSVRIPGRLVIDVKRYLQVSYPLRTYSKEEACAYLLQHPEEYIPDEILADPVKFSGNQQRRIQYMRRQAVLPLILAQKVQILEQTSEIARVTGINFRDVWTRGQILRVWSVLLRKCRSLQYFSPDESGSPVSLNAPAPLVLDPISLETLGIYHNPVLVLDFTSLYPSLMIANNLCFSTLVMKSDFSEKDSATETPIGSLFVKPHIRRGALPELLMDILQKRKNIQKMIRDIGKNSAADLRLLSILDARQKALKLITNAVYGFTGSDASKLRCGEIAESVLGYGAMSLKQAAEFFRDNYSEIRIIYGDTDSLMLLLPDSFENVKENLSIITEIGEDLANRVSRIFPDPIKMKFERAFCPFLLEQTKLYAGWEISEQKMVCKGMEFVRRDTPARIRKLFKDVLMVILTEGASLEKIQSLINEVTEDFLLGKVSISDAMITRALWRGSDSSQYLTRQAHVELADKMHKRDPEKNILRPGERIRFVFVEGSSKIQADLSEDPLTAWESELSLNSNIYVSNLIQKPLLRLLSLPGLFQESQVKKMFGNASSSSQTKPTSENQGLHQYFKLKQGNEIEDLVIAISRLERWERTLDENCRYCRTCQGRFGSRSSEIVCKNLDCFIFWDRIQAERMRNHYAKGI